MGNYLEMAKAVAGSIAARRAVAIGTQRKGVSDGEAPATPPEMPEPTEQELVHGQAGANGVDTPAPSLKGQAVELWRDGRRLFLVADEDDAQKAMRRFGSHRGEVWTGAELELVASIPDQATRDEVESFKREMDGCLSPDAAGKCAATVTHGERGRK